MLPIGQMKAASQPAVMTEPEVPEEVAVEEVLEEEPVDEMRGGKVSPESARYFGPEYRCGGCVHFMEGMDGAGECQIVAGPIDADGVCSLFTPDAEVLGADEEMPAEMPVEEAVVEDEGEMV